MKRTISTFLTLVMLLTLCAGFTAQATTVDEHKHQWKSSGDRREPTCLEPGSVYEYCTICQAWRERTIPRKGHHYPPEKWQTTKEPTCTEPGQEKNYCTNVNYGQVCGYEWRREIPALGHDWSEWYTVKKPTASEPGLEERKCNRCGITEQRPLYAEDAAASVVLDVTIADEKPSYVEGENINYIYEITNTGDMTVYIDHVYFYEPTGANGVDGWNLFPDPLEPGQSVYYYGHSHQVRDSDIKNFAPDYMERFEVIAYDNPSHQGESVLCNGWVNVTAHIGELEEVKGELTLTKTVINEPANGACFIEGEEIRFSVEIKNTGSVPLYDVEADEYPSGWTGWETDWYKLGSFEVLEPDAGASYTVNYTVKAEDCDKGEYTNLVQAIGYTEKEHGSKYDTHTYADATAPTGYDEDIGDMELVLEKTIKGYDSDDDYPSYTENDSVVFCIDVANAQNYPLYNVVIKDQDSSGLDVVLGTFEVFAPDQTEHYEIAHVFSYEECEKGVYTNTAIGEWFSDEAHGDSEDPNWMDDTVEVELWYEQGDTEMWIEKTETSVPENGSYYTEGETIYYTVEAWNCQGYPLYNVEIWDVPYVSDGMRLAEYAEFGPHQIVSFEYKHEVTAEDCEEGKFINGAVVGWQSESGEGEDSEKNWLEAEDVESPCGKAVGVVVTKKVISTPKNGEYYTEGEEIQYEVHCNNYTGEIMYDTWLCDTLVPAEKINPPGGIGNFSGFLTATYSYKVTAADAILGSVINTAFVQWKDEAGGPHSSYSDTVITLTGVEEPEGGVILTKTVVSSPANGEYYVEGETVHYVVTIANNTGKAVYDVELSDPVKGSNEDAIIDILPVLEVAESRVYDVYHKLTAEEIGGPFVNVATAVFTQVTADGINEAQELHATCSVPTEEEVYPDVELIKSETSAPLNGSFYQEGEPVTYSFVFVNNNDYPLYGVMIYDDMYSTSDPIAAVGTVGPHSSTAPVSFSYQVTPGDVTQTFITNQGCAVYFLEEGDEDWCEYSNVVTVFTGEELPPDPVPMDFQFSKRVVSASANEGYYVENETVAYLITLINNSDYPASIDGIWDQLSNEDAILATGILPDSSGVCAPHSSFTVPYSHVVTKADVVSGAITNYADVEFYVQDDRGNIKGFYLWDYVTVKTGEGPGSRQYPAVEKYVTNLPARGYYLENEDVEYDIYVYNFTGRPFDMAEGYDILLPDSGFYAANLGTINDGEVAKFHVTYKVTGADVDMKSIYNIAWVTMNDMRYDEIITIYSNEVVVPTDGITPPVEGTRTVCEYKITASGAGAEEYMNLYCSEHESMHAAVEKLLSEADTAEKKAQAQQTGIALWQRSLDSEYERLIKAASGELKSALEKDQLIFNTYIGAFKSRLEASGVSADEVFEAVTDALTDRVCELCYTQGHAPEARTDIATAETPAVKRQNAAQCTVTLDDTEEKYFTKSVNVCDRQQPLMTAIDRMFTAAGEDEKLLITAWDKAAAYWKGDFENEYKTRTEKAEPLARHYLLTEKAALQAVFEARRALYDAYYGDALLSAQLTARLIQQSAMGLCK